MLTYSFEGKEKDSLYEQLYRYIKQDILNGTIRPGEKLPSKRSFAKNLGVSVITVENAYAQLVAEGYIYSMPKSGYYAEKVGEYLLTPSEHGTKDRPGVMMNYGFEEAEGTNTETFKDPEKEQCKIDLVSGRTDPAQFPFTIWARILREILSSKQEELMTNAPVGGIRELRCAIAQYLMEYQGMNVEPEQIIVGAGTEYLYGLIIQLLGQDRIYALEDPGYAKTDKVYRSHLVNTIYIPMNTAGIDIAALRKSSADIIHISPSHQYPTGVTMPIGRRYELLSWANEAEDRYIIEDDYDCEFRLAGKPIPSLQSIDREGRVIYMNTFTRSLTSTIRISYMILPPKLLELFHKKLGFYSCTVPNFEQYTLAKFIEKGYFGKHINRMRNYYRSKRDVLIEGIRSSALSECCEIFNADAGLHFLMKVKTGYEDRELTERAETAGIRVRCLSDYINRQMDHADESKAYRHYVIVNYSGLKQEQIPILIEKLEKVWVNPDKK